MQWNIGEAYFLQGQRDDSVIYHRNDGYYYHKHHDDHPNYLTLRCTKRKSQTRPCWGAAVMARDGSYFQCTAGHTHGPDHHHVEELAMRQCLISEVATGNPQPFSVMIRSVGLRGGFSMEARSRLNIARMRTAMRNERIRFLPPIPATLFELAAFLSDPQYQHVTVTMDGQDNIFAGACGDFGAGTFSVIFMSRRQGEILQRASKVFSDGTFKKRPQKPNSCQIFVISCVWYNPNTGTKHILVCARILMQRRTIEAYVILFAFMKQLLPAWNPLIIMADHEEAQIRAYFIQFPLASIESCLFHFSVDVFRNAKSKGLHQLMQASWVVDTLVRCCAVLPLLPQDHIMYGLHAMGHWSRIMGAMRYPQVRDLFQYLHRQWSPTLHYLSVFGSEDRTNNVSESAHFVLGLEVPENRPNIYSLIGGMKRLEDQTMVDVFALQRGRTPSRPQQLRTLRNDERFRNLEDSYIQHNIDVVTFLMEAAQSNQAPYDLIFQ